MADDAARRWRANAAAAEPRPARPRPAARWSSPRIRTKFADTALWVGNLTTESNGTAEVDLNMPENLTTWRIKVWGMGHGTRVGQGQTDVVTRKDLIVRLQAPRFFVQTDEVVLSAIVHNYLKTKKIGAGGRCELDGKTLATPLATSLTAARSTDRARRARPASIGGSRCSTKARPSSA